MVKNEILPLKTQINSKDLRQTTSDIVSLPHEVILEII